jgi:hypothetical protein
MTRNGRSVKWSGKVGRNFWFIMAGVVGVTAFANGATLWSILSPAWSHVQTPDNCELHELDTWRQPAFRRLLVVASLLEKSGIPAEIKRVAILEGLERACRPKR